MLKNIIIWIFAIGKITWEYDKFFSNQQFEKNLSESYHFIIFSLILTTIFYVLHNYFFPKNKNKLLKSVYWVILITTLSASCRNKLGKDLTDVHFAFYSVTIFYCIYIHKQFYPKEETFILPKIIIIWLIVFKILWPPLIYVWPYWPRKKRPYPEDLFDDWFDIDI
jgi:hypothetical protein